MSNVLADHFVYRLNKETTLDQAIKQWQGYGFQVHYGGQHVGGVTSNALIVLKDGLYLELLAVKEDAPNAEKHKWFKPPPGWIDWAISPKQITLEELLPKLNEVDEKVKYGPAIPGARDTPGEEPKHLEWKVASPEGKVGRLPFFCEDISPRAWRVRADTSDHTNGVIGIAQIVLLAEDLLSYTQSLTAIFGPLSSSNESTAAFETTAPTGDAVTVIVRKAEGQGEVDWLKAHGEGFYRLVLDSEGEARDVEEIGLTIRKKGV